MKNKIKILVLLLVCLITTKHFSQTLGYVGRGNGITFVNTSTPIFEDIANLRIGIGLTNPNFKLDVNGDIAVRPLTNGYRIGNNYVLWNNGTTSNIFVGVNAGNANAFSNCTFVGNNAGLVNTGNTNTFMGANSGMSNTAGRNNSFFGYNAGQGTTTGIANTFSGYEAGFSNIVGIQNTFMGWHAGYLNTASSNVFIGYRSGVTNTNGTRNTFVGANSGVSNVASNDNTFMGFASGVFTNGGNGFNTFIGSQSGQLNGQMTPGDTNTYLGWQSGRNGSTNFSHNNVMLGARAGLNNGVAYCVFVGSDAGGSGANSGSGNVFIGYKSGFDNAVGGENTFVGYYAGRKNSPSGLFANGNTFIGFNSGKNNMSGDNNTFLGVATGINTDANDNTFIGFGSATVNITGTSNITLGANANMGGVNGSNLTNASAIGFGTIVMTDNSMILGGNGVNNNVNVGIGFSAITSGPGAKLDVLQDDNNSISVRSVNTGNGTTIAGWFQTQGASSYSIIVPPGSGNSGFGTTNPTVAFQVGNILDGTSALANTWNTFSDSAFKTNVIEISNGLSVVKSLRGVTFNSIVTGDSSAGFIAQEVDTVIPIIVNTDSASGMKSLDYGKIVPYLVSAIQEQQVLIDSLFGVVGGGGSRMGNQNNNSSSTTIQKDVTLSSRKIVLDQNSPNPFKDQTTITHEIKTDFKNAMIIFTDMSGEVIKEVPITEKGKGQLNVYAPDLTNGIYTYTIVVDGITIETKKMVKLN